MTHPRTTPGARPAALGTTLLLLLGCTALLLLGCTARAEPLPGSESRAAAATAPAHAAVVGTVVDDATGQPIAGARVSLQGASSEAATDRAGRYLLDGVPPGTWKVKCRADGYGTAIRPDVEVAAGRRVTVDFRLAAVSTDADLEVDERILGAPAPPHPAMRQESARIGAPQWVGTAAPFTIQGEPPPPDWNREGYDPIDELPFVPARVKPLSTVSIDVDRAAYANVRRFVEQEHRLPPPDAVRIEELLNYFTYDYPDPTGEHPFAVVTEVSRAPWNTDHRLALVAVQGRRMATAELPPSNLVFLIDVSGSMQPPNKLPLLKAAFRLLVDGLRPQDRVAIVVYAGAAGLVLPPTPGSEKDAILRALDGLEAGGSTAGGAGLRLAYDVARRSYLRGGNNRVILATDGDFNVGASSDAEMVRLIEEERKSGVALSVLGFGTGNYQDAKMEKLADHGDGNAAYIDSILEAKKVLVSELGGTLVTIAKDVKLQIELNPARVKGYRLIGYENRRLADTDFTDDTKDAGELGAGHSVTFLYEIVPAGSDEELPGVDPLKYQTSELSPEAIASDELLTVKLRYKPPGTERSLAMELPLRDRDVPLQATSDDFRFATAVAELGLLLRGSEFKGRAAYPALLARAQGALGDDPGGYRRDFLDLAERARLLAGGG